MDILQVVTDPDRRGAQVFAHDLADALSARGHTLSTVALGRNTVAESSIDTEVLGHGIRDLRTLHALRARMATVDVTVAHGGSTGPACALAGGGGRRPFVYRQISDSRFWAPTRARRLRVRLALSRTRLVIALSEFNRRELTEWIGVRPERIRIVPNGVPPDQFTPADQSARRAARAALGLEHRPTIAFAGALVPEKGGDVAIETVAALPQAVQLLIAGDGPERARLEALADEQAPGRVQFLGSRADVVPVYHAADVVVFPSRGGDAMPATIIEAGLCAVPVVATSVGAIPEMIVDGATGVLVGTDRMDQLPSMVGALLDDESRRHRLGIAARQRCLARYTIEPVAAGYEAVLGEALEG